jgi:DNA-binding response OmpR family regulator
MPRILAVDDDATSHLMLRKALEGEEYEVEYLNSAEKATERILVPGNTYAAFILDWEMPGMTGIELLQWIKQQTYVKHIPAIMLTANTEAEKIRQGIDAGAFHYITKPFNRALLLGVLRNAVADSEKYEALVKELHKAKDAFVNLHEGKFLIRTPEDAERLAVLIANASPFPEEAMIISELLNNAIEHGNLAITYDEKTVLIDSNRLKEEILKRLGDPEFGRRQAEVLFHRQPSHLVITITDEGEGFDFQKYLQFDESRVFDNHGRGIAMANSYLDIHYSGKGNKVEVRIPL